MILCSPVVLRGQASAGAPALIAPQELETLFPPSVYFQGKTAPVQRRNSAAVRFGEGAAFFAGLVDTSGYASSVQEKYQMYLLTERAVQFGDKTLPAGAYGAGFVGDRFLVMDIGGHVLAEGATQMDEKLARPRPLQMVLSPAGEGRLYLGKRWVRVSLAPGK
ncbi:MAG: hypothetical protein ACRYF4_10510 [Janthinobacterium lividum]